MPQVDYRARLKPKDPQNANDILGPKDSQANILAPLWSTGGVLFPYTPTVSTGNTAEYDTSTFIQSNYGYNAYKNSAPKPISIDATFTAQTNDEAIYLLAVIHFFRAITKSYFGVSVYDKAGTPPPTLLFSYLGDYMFNNVPVIVKDFSFTLETNVDYVPVSTALNNGSTLGYSPLFQVDLPRANVSTNQPSVSANTGYTYVPNHMAVHIELDTQYIPIVLRQQFNLDKFRSGTLLGGGYL